VLALVAAKRLLGAIAAYERPVPKWLKGALKELVPDGAKLVDLTAEYG
jgi:hypothetical protein